MSTPLRIRIGPEETALLDLVRGSIPRATWIREAIRTIVLRWQDLPPREGLVPEASGDRKAVGFRLATEDLERVDSARGGHARDLWLREAVMRFAAGVQAGAWS